MSLITGSQVAKSVALVSKIGDEINALQLLLHTQIITGLEQAELPFVFAGGAQYSDCVDESGWVYTGIAESFPLKGSRRKKNPEAYLGFQISLEGDGINIPGLNDNEPLIHVFCWNDPCDFSEENYLSFEGLEKDDQSVATVENNRLLVWDGPYETSQTKLGQVGWAYSLRLLSLNTPEDLKRHIIDPAIALLRGSQIIHALPDSLPALVRYPSSLV